MSDRTQADLGGTPDSRPIVAEAEGELFHAPWEARVLALSLAMGATGLWNIDMSRAARETLHDYAKLSYYEIWLAGLEKLLLSHGAVGADELRDGRTSAPAIPVRRVLQADAVAAVLAKGAPVSRAATRPPLFRLGQAVRTRVEKPRHHTRLPDYARGKRGIVDRVHGTHVFADTHAQGLGEQSQWLYTIAFDPIDLWGDEQGRSATRDSVCLDAWEPYLETA
jgi:nitrile hydratase